jgi:hypothetical protein
VGGGSSVTIEIHVNTGNLKLGAFGFILNYPMSMFSYTLGMEIVAGLNLMINTNTNSDIALAGFNANGVPGGTDIALIKVTLVTLASASGTGTIALSIQTLADASGTTIGTLSATGATITACGDCRAPTVEPTVAPTPTAVQTIGPGSAWIVPAS